MNQTATTENHPDTDSNQTDENPTDPVRMSITLPPLLHKLVIDAAREADRSAASLIREAIKAYLFREIGNKAPLPRARKSYIYNSNRLSSFNPMDRQDEDSGRGSSLELESNRAPARDPRLHADGVRRCEKCDASLPTGECFVRGCPIMGSVNVDVRGSGQTPAEIALLVDEGTTHAREAARRDDNPPQRDRATRSAVYDAQMARRDAETGVGGLIWPSGPLDSFSDSSRLKALSQATFAYPGVDHQAIIGRLHERLTQYETQSVGREHGIAELARFFAEDQKSDAVLISETAHARAVSMENLRQTYLDGPWQWDADHVPGGKSWSFVQWCGAVKRGAVEL